ncbi:hypothetical protein RFK12_00545 [Streptococcus suis]|uniref:hypothetical protein n=1 Tax=Streptococcus suis TaxID=1307 RepID=UPI00040DC18B|nr:hypothetical protein [Streptococcus suis]NQL51695.1 hypothetical protein [Streptococcus suis]WNF76621.1 hypothetical protein RJW56_04700 [Streptococcus suis]HEM2910812.1 hypothetical protein [Streptococcus suis]HEM3187168.1 hypothetical protein [Streptococcus suis 89-2479]HEM3708777.1 hypothetical protein [Streptococcus suis]
MNIYFWLALVCGTLAILLLLLWDWLEEDSSDQTSNYYSPEEQALAEYLEKKQAINEVYLKAHAELLKSYKR